MMLMLTGKDDAHVKQVVGRALVALFDRQTRAEQKGNNVQNSNMLGFSGVDAKSGSITAKYFIKHKTLEDWQLETWMRDFRGHPRITKYARQLNEIAIEKKILKLKAMKWQTSNKDEKEHIDQQITDLTNSLD